MSAQTRAYSDFIALINTEIKPFVAVNYLFRFLKSTHTHVLLTHQSDGALFLKNFLRHVDIFSNGPLSYGIRESL